MWFGAWLCSSFVYCVFSHCCVHLFALLFVFFGLTVIISVIFGRVAI